MQNRFKFRAWDSIAKEYIFDSYALYELFVNDIDNSYQVEQCTGLKDKNGKLIYEGDILAKSPTYSPSYGCYKVFFQKDECSFKVIPCEGSHDYAIPLNVLTKKNDFQIIGNIHKNPELLEEK